MRTLNSKLTAKGEYMEQKKTIAVTVENQPGVLARMAGLFRAGRST